MCAEYVHGARIKHKQADAARKQFQERGYERATIRRIATSADVHPALVDHYFG
ncbi:MAG: TetR/AcrR family transcriptional regulator, partial [Proteobacteria bacterium]|nr:TetR/AcrR family transcriptional regulator [Pseudomonadota bacterium]